MLSVLAALKHAKKEREREGEKEKKKKKKTRTVLNPAPYNEEITDELLR
jgi:hypothetical protein